MSVSKSQIEKVLYKALEDYENPKYPEGLRSKVARASSLGVSQSGDRSRIDICSDGLSLTDKISLERYLIEELASLSCDILIYFKKSEVASTLTGAKVEPAPLNEPTRGPFGITLKKKAIPGVSKVIAVSSGKGGVGKSTVSTNLAVALAQQGEKVGLLDADIYGPSAPLMLGLKGPVSVNDGMLVPLEAHGIKCMSFGFMADENTPVIWRGPLVSKALKQLFYETSWGELDYLIVDLPPGTGDVQMTMIEQLPLHGGLVVSTPQNVALLDAQKGLKMFQTLGVPVLGVVENMAYYECSQCGHNEQIFGNGVQSFAGQNQLPIVASIPLNAHVRLASDEGTPIALGDHAKAQPFKDLACHIRNTSVQ